MSSHGLIIKFTLTVFDVWSSPFPSRSTQIILIFPHRL